MRIASWDHYSVDYRRFTLMALAGAILAGCSTYAMAEGVVGPDSLAVGAIIGSAVLYFILSLPKRLLETASIGEARAATTLSASASAIFAATRSRSRTFLALTSDDPGVSGVAEEMKRQVLLGVEPIAALSGAKSSLASDSAERVFESLAGLRADLIDVIGDESEGLAKAAELSDESKMPIFMGAAFFSPIMLVLLAVLTHDTGAMSLAELVGVEVVVLDAAFYYSSMDRGRLR